MKNIAEARAELTLNKVFRYDEGVMTRREWIRLKIAEGYVATEETRRNYAAEDKLREWLRNNMEMRSGNTNWPPTKKWNDEERRLNEGIYKTEYHLGREGESCYFDITKTEYDYIKTLSNGD